MRGRRQAAALPNNTLLLQITAPPRCSPTSPGQAALGPTASPEAVLHGVGVAIEAYLRSDEMTPESVTAYRSVFDDVHSRKAYEVEVIGHTDTLGNFAYNQQLSLARAAAFRDRLIGDGIAPGAISIAGRGKLDLLIPTDDQVAEPRNRVVEILVR